MVQAWSESVREGASRVDAWGERTREVAGERWRERRNETTRASPILLSKVLTAAEIAIETPRAAPEHHAHALGPGLHLLERRAPLSQVADGLDDALVRLVAARHHGLGAVVVVVLAPRLPSGVDDVRAQGWNNAALPRLAGTLRGGSLVKPNEPALSACQKRDRRLGEVAPPELRQDAPQVDRHARDRGSPY